MNILTPVYRGITLTVLSGLSMAILAAQRVQMSKLYRNVLKPCKCGVSMSSAVRYAVLN